MDAITNPLRGWILTQIKRGGESKLTLAEDVATCRRLGILPAHVNGFSFNDELATMEKDGLISIDESNFITHIPPVVIKQTVLF